MMADFIALYQVFMDLVGNAVKFCGADKVPQIHISSRTVDGMIIFSVADQGIGISSEELKTIFREGEHKDGYEGYGIGLPSCQAIIIAGGGKIKAESNGLGKGSMFIFTIPI